MWVVVFPLGKRGHDDRQVQIRQRHRRSSAARPLPLTSKTPATARGASRAAREHGLMEKPMKQCSRCGHPYDDVLPFCLRCEGYEAVSHIIWGNYLVVTYRKTKAPLEKVPTMWRE